MVAEYELYMLRSGDKIRTEESQIQLYDLSMHFLAYALQCRDWILEKAWNNAMKWHLLG
jgi:hypothetical protein